LASKATPRYPAHLLHAGCAVEDFNWPDRIVLGTTSSEAVLALKQVFHPLDHARRPVIVTNHEQSNYCAWPPTAFSHQISFINEIAISANTSMRRHHLSLASASTKNRPTLPPTGSRMGGSSLLYDMDSLDKLASEKGIVMKVLGAAREVNNDQTGHSHE